MISKEVQYFENDKEVRLTFPKGVDPQVLIDEIEKIIVGATLAVALF